MPRSIWKGAISFGLVHVPVGLYSASQQDEVDFDWLDRRTMDPVGYKRVNKRTGREIGRDDIVKGVKQKGGEYVVLSDEEIRKAYPKTTQTIEIEAFVDAKDIPFYFMEKPYYLKPEGKADKVYALLREAMREAGVVGIARFVMHSKEHLAALIPHGPALMLNTLRWADEVRPDKELKLPPAGRNGAKLKDAELKMAAQLIRQMTAAWKPEAYAENFTGAIRALVARKAKAGKTETVEPLEEAPGRPGNVIDLMAVLKQSLGKAKAPAQAKKATGVARAARPAAQARLSHG
jgi:DNA end-binding protein Ku